jgi:hypothetical protein
MAPHCYILSHDKRAEEAEVPDSSPKVSFMRVLILFIRALMTYSPSTRNYFLISPQWGLSSNTNFGDTQILNPE